MRRGDPAVCAAPRRRISLQREAVTLVLEKLLLPAMVGYNFEKELLVNTVGRSGLPEMDSLARTDRFSGGRSHR